MTAARVGIIGVGPRGLTVLERIVANERQQRSGDIEVLLFDPNPPGSGCHDPEQSDIHLVNTVAGQLTMFADPSVIDAGPVMNGPSFVQWLQEHRGIGASELSRRISPDAYYSRGLFGRYLVWVFRYICALAPAHVKVIVKRTPVDRVHRVDDGSWVLETVDAKVRVDYLVLTTGHTKPAKHVSDAHEHLACHQTIVVDDPYPIKQRLEAITPGMTVAIEGMGLTTNDVVAELTTGRGGEFITNSAGDKRYLRSGREPRIVLFSRSGIPLSARAHNQKGVSNQYRARFLTLETMRQLRSRGKIDFVADVLPLLVADMEYAYYEAYLRERRNPVAAVIFCQEFASADASGRHALVVRHIPPEDHFSWGKLAAPVPAHALAGRAHFKRWLLSYLQRDVREARKGNVDSPLKASCDVLRDVRDNLRAAIEFGGLTEPSHRWLLSEFMPVMNRLAVGPPESRVNELLALMAAGVLEADFGPGATCQPSPHGGLMRVVSARWGGESAEVHALVKARISMHSPTDDASPLLRGLLADGYVRPYRNGSWHPGGIEIDRNHNWVSANGTTIHNAWALGIPTEGVKWYTFVVPRPGVNSTAVVDAGRVATKLLLSIKSKQYDSASIPSAVPSEAEASAYASLSGAF